MIDFLLVILYASTPFAIIALTICLGNSLAERRAVELHWRRMVVRRAQKLNGRIFDVILRLAHRARTAALACSLVLAFALPVAFPPAAPMTAAALIRAPHLGHFTGLPFRFCGLTNGFGHFIHGQSVAVAILVPDFQGLLLRLTPIPIDKRRLALVGFVRVNRGFHPVESLVSVFHAPNIRKRLRMSTPYFHGLL